MCNDEVVIVHMKRGLKRPQESEGESDYTPPLAGAAPSSASEDANQSAPRRSTRLRSRPDHFVIQAPASQDPDSSQVPHRLEQIDCLSAVDLGLPETHLASRLKITIHPVAMALISFHAHLTRTEVIGYLGGAVHQSDDGCHLMIAEAFPAQALGDKALARSGRNAFTEVEIDPESSVEVMSRLTQKKLQVVGWYHSHPDASFTVEPSRVDIENQSNYQQFIFKDTPFVAAIVAPYNEDLPDHNPELQFFHVHEEQTPVKLPFSVGLFDPDAIDGYAHSDSQFPIDDFVAESLTLVANYWQFAKRVRLERDWREGVPGLEKLRSALTGVIDDVERNDCDVFTRNKDAFLCSVQLIMENVERRWKESGEEDDQRRERSQQAAARKKKRNRQR